MHNNTVQIVICTYQGEQYIAEQLDSIVAQTYAMLEVHIFDDCSTDNTLSIVKEYCKCHQNFFWYKNLENIGFLKNFENAISCMSGHYIALCDQDDVWHSEKLERCMREIKDLEKSHPGSPALVHTDLSIIDCSGNLLFPSFFKKKKIDLPEEKSLSRIMGHCGVMGNTILMNRYLIKKALPFPENLQYHDYWLALVNEIYGSRKTLNKPYINYRIHKNNTSGNNTVLVKSRFQTFLHRDYPLPFREDNREAPIRHLLDEYSLNADDEILIRHFYNYLTLEGSRFFHFSLLFRYNFLKNNFLYRLGVLFRILFSNRSVGRSP